MAILYQFGSYAYPKCVITKRPREIVARPRVAETPGRAGQYTQGGLLAPRSWSLTGHLIPLPGDDLDTLVDALFAAHAPSVPQALYTGRDDRYSLAEVSGFKDMDSDKYSSSVMFEASFIASDPYIYAATPSSTSLSTGSGGSTNVTVGGTAPAVPVIALVITSGTSTNVGTIIVTNTTTGKSFTITTPVPGADFSVDCSSQRVTRTSNGADLTYLIAGTFFDLSPGVTNAITTAVTGGVSLQTATITWRNRWY